MKKLILIFIICVFAVNGWGVTYYVSQSGTGDGSTASTPDSVTDYKANVFGDLAGDTVYFLGAITETIGIVDGGTSDNVATHRFDYPGQEGTINGLVTEAGPWSDEGSNVYSTGSITTEPKWVLYDGAHLTPNDGQTTSVGSNEFDWNANTLYMNVGEDPTSGTVQISKLVRAVSFGAGDDYVDLIGGTFEYFNSQGVFIYDAEHINISETTIKKVWGYGITSTVGTGNTISDITVHDNYLYDCEYGIYFNRTSGGIISGNYLSHTLSLWGTAHGGGYLGGSAIQVRDDDDAGRSIDHAIYNNHIDTYHGNGIFALSSGSSGHPVEIYNNILYMVGDGIAIEDSNYIEIYNNGVVYTQIYDSYPCMKIGTNFGSGTYSDYLTIRNNLFINKYNVAASRPIISTNGGAGGAGIGTNSTMTHNIFQYVDDPNPGTTTLFNWWENGEGSLSAYTWAGFQAYQTGKYTANSFNSDPLFVNAADKDFSLTSTSPAIDAGSNLGDDYDEDFNGRDQDDYGDDWDIGAILFPYAEYLANPVIVRARAINKTN